MRIIKILGFLLLIQCGVIYVYNNSIANRVDRLYNEEETFENINPENDSFTHFIDFTLRQFRINFDLQLMQVNSAYIIIKYTTMSLMVNIIVIWILIIRFNKKRE